VKKINNNVPVAQIEQLNFIYNHQIVKTEHEVLDWKHFFIAKFEKLSELKMNRLKHDFQKIFTKYFKALQKNLKIFVQKFQFVRIWIVF
jgi:hypothetical protein